MMVFDEKIKKRRKKKTRKRNRIHLFIIGIRDGFSRGTIIFFFQKIIAKVSGGGRLLPEPLRYTWAN